MSLYLFKKSQERLDRARLISKLSTRRYKARMKAKQKGLKINPEVAVKKKKSKFE